MSDLDYLKGKYPLMHHAPDENCKRCKGRGEFESKTSLGGLTPCICIFVNHDFAPEAARMLAKAARRALEICDIHVEEVMGNLNKAVGGLHGGVVGGHLGSPTPEQIDHDIIGELSRLRQKVAELENNKKFYEDIAKDIAKRLNETEDKLKSIEEQFLHFIELRKIKGGFCGCEAIIDIETQDYNILKACLLHLKWADRLRTRDIKGTG